MEPKYGTIGPELAENAAAPLEESCPGYALRLTSFTLMAMAQNFTQLRGTTGRDISQTMVPWSPRNGCFMDGDSIVIPPKM